MKKKLLFLGILILSIGLRFLFLGDTPPGVLVDEASNGYNAYSIMKTGQDEWGERYPLMIRSFGDFKPPGYIYLTIPFIEVFGLNPFSVRLPSATLGVISILCLYLIVLLITKDDYLALLSAFFFSISPWHIYVSRMAWETNVAMGFFLLGLTFFLFGVKRGYLFLFLSAVFFSLTTYVYIGYRILTPILLLFIILFFLKKRLLTTRSVLIFLAIIFFLNLPFTPVILSKQANSRFEQISTFGDKGSVQFIDEQRNFCGFAKNTFLLKTCYLIWNKPTVFSLNFLKNYLATISPDFLFLSGDDFKFVNNPNHGGMYLWFFPLFFLGLAKIVRNIEKSHYQFLFWWFMISPLMSAVAGPPNFIRSNMVFIPVAVICALGVYCAVDILKKLKVRRISISRAFLALVISISLVSTVVLAIDYFFVYTKKVRAWDEYYPQVFSFLKKIDKDYEVIYFHKLNDQPYIYMLFYQAIEPKFFLKAATRDNYDVLSIGKYQFVDFGFGEAFCRWQKGDKTKTLLVTDEDNLWPKSIAPEPLFEVKSFNGVHTLALIYDIGETVDYFVSKKIELPKCETLLQVK